MPKYVLEVAVTTPKDPAPAPKKAEMKAIVGEALARRFGTLGWKVRVRKVDLD